MLKRKFRIRSKNWLFAMVVMIAFICVANSIYADTYEVTLEGMSFWYEGQSNMNIELVVLPGDTVRWLWVQGNHNVVSGYPETKGTGDLFFSGPPTDAPGTIFEYTFLESGEFGYHCHPHEEFGMISFVTVVPEPSCPWDLDGTETVGTTDLLEMFAQWGTKGTADFDGSGAVGTSDLLILFANWGPCS